MMSANNENTTNRTADRLFDVRIIGLSLLVIIALAG